jgi:uncharacterized Fe-S cluster protein YjdI
MENLHKDIIKEYSNGRITVLWEPSLCTHCTVCYTLLPSVFKPNERPWIDINGASDEEIIDQVEECPSDALRMKQKK